jgi:hypothetical protein
MQIAGHALMAEFMTLSLTAHDEFRHLVDSDSQWPPSLGSYERSALRERKKSLVLPTQIYKFRIAMMEERLLRVRIRVVCCVWGHGIRTEMNADYRLRLRPLPKSPPWCTRAAHDRLVDGWIEATERK